MNLTQPSQENVEYMIDQIKEKLRKKARKSHTPYTTETADYEELHELYSMVKKRSTFSPSEMQAIATELGSLRK